MPTQTETGDTNVVRVTAAAQEGGDPTAAPSRPGTATAGQFKWSQVEAGDYPTYIANLRRAGCPERTLREIITADVADLYGQKRQELGLDKAGLWTGRWSWNEEAAFIAALFGETPDSNPGSRPLGNSPVGEVAASLPLVFQTKALDSLELNDEQKADLDWLRGQFLRDIGGLNQDPSAPGYLERWQKAQPKIDEYADRSDWKRRDHRTGPGPALARMFHACHETPTSRSAGMLPAYAVRTL